MDNQLEELWGFKDIYREIGELVGEENTIKIFHRFRGIDVTFPSKLYDTAYVYEQLSQVHKPYSVTELARKYYYSTSYISKMLRKIRQEEGENYAAETGTGV